MASVGFNALAGWLRGLNSEGGEVLLGIRKPDERDQVPGGLALLLQHPSLAPVAPEEVSPWDLMIRFSHGY